MKCIMLLLRNSIALQWLWTTVSSRGYRVSRKTWPESLDLKHLICSESLECNFDISYCLTLCAQCFQLDQTLWLIYIGYFLWLWKWSQHATLTVTAIKNSECFYRHDHGTDPDARHSTVQKVSQPYKKYSISLVIILLVPRMHCNLMYMYASCYVIYKMANQQLLVTLNSSVHVYMYYCSIL